MFLTEVLDSFERHKLKYALVGGYALALHGVVRATVDIDVVVQISKTQMRLVEAALQEVGLQSRLPIKADDVVNFRKDYIENKNLIAWSFVDYKDPSKMVDVLITEDLKKLKIKKISIPGRKISVASLEDLLRMKTGTGRLKDELDVQAIEGLLNENKK